MGRRYEYLSRDAPLRIAEAVGDFINLAMGGLLFASPWLFGFNSEGRHTAWIAGAAIFILAAFSMADLFETIPVLAVFESEEWINLTVGLWVAICPWILGFYEDANPRNVHFTIGLVVALVAAVELWLLRHRPHPK